MQKIRIHWTSTTGVGHIEEFGGDELVVTPILDRVAVIRVMSAAGETVAVYTRWGVNSTDWSEGPASEGDA